MATLEIQKRKQHATFRRLLTIEEAAQLCGWQPATLRSKVYRREIEYCKMGRSVRFRPETIERLIEDGTVLPLMRRATA